MGESEKMGDSEKRVAVIGAGCSGLTAIKACLEEGLTPVCFERSDHVGGLWYFTEEGRDGVPCVSRSTVINTSKEMMAYSDFPVPGRYANYMHNTTLMDYFRAYMDHFALEKHIRYHTEVLEAVPAQDFAATGRWDIKVKDVTTGVVTMETFDAMMVCSGHHADKHMPHIEGEELFEGKRVHTHDYKDNRGYEGKRAVVIGIGNSGADLNLELSRVCQQVYLSTRRGAWVIHRVFDGGLPLDVVITRRWLVALLGLLPPAAVNALWELKLNARFNHHDYGLRPAHGFLAQHPTLSDDLPNRILCGSIEVKPDVARLTARDVHFSDGTVAENVDAVFYATGYKFGFPFIKHPALEVRDNQVNLYKYVFPPDMEKATVAVIGCIQPVGAILPIAELQCRWAAQIFKGTNKLPNKSEMWADIRKKQRDMAERYVASQRHTIQVDWIPFMDEVATQVGCKPDLGAILLEDPRLAVECFFGPCTPYQYRLTGPGVWPGARQAIMTQWERIYAPLRTRTPHGARARTWPVMAFYLALLVLAAILVRAVLYLIL